MPLQKLTTLPVPTIGGIQDTSFTRDALSRFVCNTLDEALAAAPGGFDIIVVGAGMYGAYCATDLFNKTKNLGGGRPRPKILVLQEGPFLIPEHFQNLPLGLGGLYGLPLAPLLPEGQYRILTADGTPEREDGNEFDRRDFGGKFRPHHRCVGGKSLFWGGWAPSLTAADLALWSPSVSDFLNSEQGYHFVSQDIGADYDLDRGGKEKDFIYGLLYEALLKRARAEEVTPFSYLPDQYSIDRVLQPPIAVKVEAELSGLFSPDKYSSLPGLLSAIRQDIGNSDNNDQNRYLFLVPNVTVLNLETQEGVVRSVRIAVNDPVGTGEVVRNISLPEQGMVVLAANCINSTRIALNSFPRPSLLTKERMGANLMVHIRGNYVWKIRRTHLESLEYKDESGNIQQLKDILKSGGSDVLQQAALHIEGTATNLGPKGLTGRFHLQFYAVPNGGGSAEASLYQLIPDRDDLLEKIRQLEGEPDANEWITVGIRTCGEDFGDREAPVEVGGQRSGTTSWMDISPSIRDRFDNPEGFVQLVETPEALALRRAQRAAAFRFIARLADVSVEEVGQTESKGANSNIHLVSAIEDGMGTTYHECGTLWMGDDPETSVTDVHGRFHHVANAYCADQALFPTAGSANPVPTGLALARKVALGITKRYQEEKPFADGDAGFQSLFNGSFDGAWRSVGAPNFTPLVLSGQPPIIEAGQAGGGGLGLLYYPLKPFKNFILRLEWKAFSIRANSGIFLRIPDPAGRNLDPSFYDQCTEVQIDETARNPRSVFGGFREKTGAIYTLAPATQGMSKVIRPRFTLDGPWNVFEITAQDSSIVVSLNGTEVSRTNIAAPRLTEGYLALQCHTEIVQFRNIRLKELP
ncbi:family 16 glycoside hydrolase [Phormidesmis sp. 146-35]